MSAYVQGLSDEVLWPRESSSQLKSFVDDIAHAAAEPVNASDGAKDGSDLVCKTPARARTWHLQSGGCTVGGLPLLLGWLGTYRALVRGP
jgi:hypothetical protein